MELSKSRDPKRTFSKCDGSIQTNPFSIQHIHDISFMHGNNQFGNVLLTMEMFY